MDLEIAFQELDFNKLPGKDGIHGQMLLNLSQQGRRFLLDIFNTSWKAGKLPRDWKEALIIPIRKHDKPANDPNSYRPIALASISCKLMQRIVLRRLSTLLDQNNLIPLEQFDFRKGHCTMDQVLYFSQKVRDAHNLRPTNHTVAAFHDLSKAFDRFWKYKLVSKFTAHSKSGGEFCLGLLTS
ncbi:putative RNA-directed DNA polymerase from transposon BS [Trichonephila clavata]|uniref:Putative RNA-directed DNA polymerase from transposon BS n=1 Tax=Trichonephila clavata TaxID=2740835 RepID=A0A8X6HJS1_TRICU|nr:putative RNA-directed DNA polymerase from transposon BS [Trichonephila clavata]